MCDDNDKCLYLEICFTRATYTRMSLELKYYYIRHLLALIQRQKGKQELLKPPLFEFGSCGWAGMRAATELLAGCALIWVLGTWEVRHVWLHVLFLVFLIAWSGRRLTTARMPCCHFGAWPQKRNPTQICVQFQNSSAPPRISLPPNRETGDNTYNTLSVSRYSSRAPVRLWKRKHLPSASPSLRRWKANIFPSVLFNYAFGGVKSSSVPTWHIFYDHRTEQAFWSLIWSLADICLLKTNQSNNESREEPTQGSTSRIFPLFVLMKRRPWQAL